MRNSRSGSSRGQDKEPRYPWTRKRRDGWQAVFSVAGRREYGPRRATRKQAYEDAQMMRARVLNGDGGELVTVLQAIKAFLAYHVKESKKDTVSFYRGKLEDFMAHIRPTTSLWQISHLDLLEFLEKRRDEGAERSIPHYRRALNAWLNWCVGEQLIDRNPIQKIAKARLKALTRAKPKRFPWLPQDVIIRICDLVEQSGGDELCPHSEPQFAADVVRLLYLSGLRRAEVCRLTPGHVDFTRGLVYVDGKREGDHDSQQLVAITEELEPVLQRLVKHAQERRVQSRGYLAFKNKDSLNTLFHRIRKYLKERHKDDFEDVGLDDFTPHAMRHSLGTNLIRQGVPLANVQMILRHKTPVMTARYVHANAPDLRESAARVSLLPSQDRPEAPAGDDPVAGPREPGEAETDVDDSASERPSDSPSA
jgi:integrase